MPICAQPEAPRTGASTDRSSKKRTLRSSKAFACMAVALGLGLASSQADARTLRAHGHGRISAVIHRLFDVPLPTLGLQPIFKNELPTAGKPYELRLTRNEQTLDVVYRIGDIYDPKALSTLDEFLHDSHNGEIASYDPRTFDILYTVLAKLGRSGSTVDILSAYRTQQTNDELREEGGTNAAEHSQHIVATALDLRVPGVSPAALREAALSLHAGGVGYYPRGQFVHLDAGPVRQWTYAPHEVRRHSARHRRLRG